VRCSTLIGQSDTEEVISIGQFIKCPRSWLIVSPGSEFNSTLLLQQHGMQCGRNHVWRQRLDQLPASSGPKGGGGGGGPYMWVKSSRPLVTLYLKK